MNPGERITDNLDALLAVLPIHIPEALKKDIGLPELLELVMDLGRPPEARYPHREVVLDPRETAFDDIDYVVARLGQFSGDNRAGIERTLHRISAMRNRQGRIVGLTLRVGRAVFGTMRIIQDLVETGHSVLLLGRPGIGKTTMLREVARVLADDFRKRVIIVDTSNEIAGDGDIPHPAIGHARRMQVPSPSLQHAVMIEAVENHMPEVIVIDEIGIELEAAAARTIAERGVQLVATAHGNTLGNLLMNPTLADLVGGVQPVTLGDEEARRRRTQKTVLERKAPPTFPILVEIQERDRVAIHSPVGDVVDALLRGEQANPEIRSFSTSGEVRRDRGGVRAKEVTRFKERPLKLYPYGVSRDSLEKVIGERHAPVAVVDNMDDAELLVTTKAFYRRRVDKVKQGESRGLPIYVLRSNSANQVRQFLSAVGVGEPRPSPEEGEAQLRTLQQRMSRFGFTSRRRKVKKL